LTQNFNINRKI